MPFILQPVTTGKDVGGVALESGWKKWRGYSNFSGQERVRGKTGVSSDQSVLDCTNKIE